MAEDSNKEQLEIQAKLDTSQLKKEAKQAFNEVVKEEKKVEEQSKQTSKAIDDVGKSGKKAADSLQETGEAGKKVGDSLQQAGQAGSQALKEVSKEAEKTASKISDIDKSVKNLKLGQAIGIASRLANSDIGKGIGNAVGDSLGMTESEMGMAGNALQGGLQGAAMGAMVAGPWGAVVGGLAGAATGLIQAAEEQKQAARELALGGENRAKAILNQQLKKDIDRASQEEYDRVAANPFEMVTGKWYANGETKQVTAVQDAIDKLKWQIDGYEEQIQWAVDDLKMLNGMDTSKWSKEEVESWNADIERNAQDYEEYNARLEDAKKRLAAFEALQAQLNNLPVGPEIPEYIRAQRDAEANLPVGPEMPEHIKAQRDAEEKARQEAAKRDAEFEKIKNANWQKEQRDLAASYRNEAKEKLASISGMSGMKLTDSLTQIGGGAGYGSQMRGITDHVQRVVNEVKKLNGIADSILNKMDNIKNEGVFTGDSE